MINARLDRLDAASAYGAWTREMPDPMPPRGEVVVDAGLDAPRHRAPATRALRGAGVTTLEQVSGWSEQGLRFASD